MFNRPLRNCPPTAPLVYLLIPVVTLAVAGCGPRNQYFEPPPPEVTVATPQQQDVTRYLELTGTTQPIVTVDVRARVRGFLKERHFDEGSIVQKGQLLLVIDEEPFQLQRDQSKARCDEAETNLRKAEQSRARELAKAKLALDQAALSQTESSEARLRKLISGRAVTQDEFERAETARKQAAAQVESSLASLDQSEADFETNILSAQAAVAAAHTTLRNAEIELAYCRMSAPIAGRITETYSDVGNLVGDGQASLLATIVQLDPIHVYMTLSESDFLLSQQNTADVSTAAGAPVEMAFSGDQKFSYQGTIDYHDPSIDAGTGTIRIRGCFPNPQGHILPGTFAHMRLAIGNHPGALLVPERALGTDQSGQYLLAVGADDVVEYRAVKVGSRAGDLRVVEGAVQPQDRIVVEGLLRARPGIKVVPKAAVASAPSPAGGADKVAQRPDSASRP